MDSKWGGSSGYSSHHRQSLRPSGVTASAGLASRYGLSSSSSSSPSSSRNGSSSGAASTGSASTGGVGSQLSSSVVSFMRKFVSKASNSNSIDNSFQQYKELQQQQQSSGSKGGSHGASGGKGGGSSAPPTGTASTSSVFAPCGPAAAAGATSSSSTSGNVPATAASSSLGALPSHHSDTGYSSITNSPATTPTVSSISASPIPPAQLISSSSFASDGQSGSRPSSAASTTGGSSATSATSRGPLFSKIRAKMVSTFQATNTGECSNAANVAQPVQPTAAPAAFLAQQSSNTSSSSQSGSNPIQRPESSASLGTGSGTDAQSIASSRQQRSSSITSTSGTVAPMGGSTSPVAGTETSAQRPPMLSMLSQSHSSSLTNEQLTAHLTEEEKKILEKVFQKEEEFREIALKNFVKNTSLGEGATGVGTSGQPTATMLLTGSPVSGVSHLSANMLDPVAAAVHRRRSSAIISSDASGQCRICRKIIMRDESAHRCSNCQELVCDDCSSYSAREESKYWMCSFCRRRGSHLIITTVGTDTTCTSTTSTASAQTSSTFPSHSASSHHHRSSFSALSGVAAAAVPGGSSNPNNTNSSISISVSKSPEPSFSPPAHRSHSTSSSVTAPVSQPQMSQLLSTAASSSSSSSPSSHPPINTFTSTSATTPMFSTSSTLQPGTVAKRKSSFSECQMRPHGHEAITSQRQSSLDLQKSAILLQQHQRKSAQFSQSPLLYEQQQQQQQTSTQQQIAQSWGQIEQQPSKIPRVELPPSQPQMGDAHPLSYFSTTSGANLSSVIGGISAQPALSQPGQISSQFSSSSQLIQPQPSSNITSPSLTTSTTTPTTVALSPQNGTSRPRIYSLSDDEELLSDDDDDDDEEDDEEFEDDVAENDEEEEEELFEDDAEEFGEEFARRLTQQRKIHRKKVLKETILDDAVLLSECKKRPTNANGRHKTRKGVLSPHKDDSYIHMIGGPSHGTLASVPAETLKRRRSSKRKKKKSPHAGQSYNSDDELMTSSVAKQSEDNAANLPSGATHFVGRRESGAGLSVPMGQNLSTFADVVNTVTGNSLLHRASISEFPLSQGSVSGLGMQRPLSSALYGPGKPLTALQMAYKPNQAIASKWWRLSKKVGSMNRSGGLINVHDNSIFGYGSGLRQRKSSESSDVSDVRYSPTQDSLTPSSEYSRSPRESADSEMLGLTYSSLAMQRRSIPSVLVDVGADSSGLATGHFLTLKDCYNRRGSAGRALPQIPVEPSRSMLDLPHSRKSSAHSLDIPMEQPRRASAPEGENIRIVIDEVQDVTGSHQELLISGAGGVVQDSNYARSASAGSGRRSSGAIVPQTTVVTQVQVAPQGQTSYQQRMRYQLTRAASIVTHYERIILHRDEQDHSNRTRGFGLAVVGGRLNDQDGMLYAYVNWTKPGGPADKQGLKPGDKILEWCTKSLVNCSYEQVCHIMDSCGESAELIVESMVKCDPNQHKRRQSLAAAQQQTSSEQASTSQSPSQQPKIAINAPASSTTNTSAVDCTVARPSSAAAALLPSTSSIPPPITAPAATSQVQPQAASDRGSASSTPRRRLPAIPTTPKSTASTAALLNDAQILLQVTLDASIRQLSVVIVSSRGLEQHPLYNKAPKTANVPDNEAFAQLRLLPEMGFKVCQTELNANFEWNETLIYHQFPLERVDEITLEVSVWSTTANSVSPYYQQAPAQLAPPANQIRLRSPRNSAVGLPPQISVSSSEHSSTFQLASTRIPLRSALFVLSEWWPLIPTEVNYVQAPLDLSTGKSSGGGNGSSMSVPSPAPNLPSTAPPVFFHKVPSMDYIDVSSGNLLCESIMMSRSTPGSRRNSGRSDAGMEMIVEASPCVEEAPDEELVGVGVFSAASDNTASAVQQPPPKRPTTASSMYRPPTRGSTATLNSSGGRHSLDDSSYSNSMGPKSTGDGGSLSLDRTTSLRLIQNRHSVGNLYHLPAGVASDAQAAATLASSYIRGAHLAAPYQEQYERRKSSSALGQDTSGKSVVGTSSTAPGGAQPLFAGGGYSRFTGTRQDDSCQYLLQSQNLGQPSISDQDTSPFSSDDDIDNLLLDDSNFNSDQNTPVRPTTTFPNFRPQSSASMMGGCPSTTVAQAAEILSQPSKKLSDTKLNQLTVVDTNKLSIASIDDPSRYSGTASPVTPSNEEEPEDASGSVGSQQNLLAPNWAVGRRKSFLQRMIPTAVAAGASLLLNRPDEGTLAAEPPKSVVVGEIKLGFIMTKGLFEIEVVAARGLPDSVMGPFPPDTYVKTYVHDKGRQLHKRKTRVIPADKNPQYRQTLKYDANILFDRTLLVSVWEKQKRTFDSNVPIGAMEINVNQLELHKLTIRWYKLRSFVTGTESLPIAPVLTNEPSTSDPTTDRAEQ